jgi:hypothetical protein
MEYFRKNKDGVLEQVCFRDILGQKLAEDLNIIKSIKIDCDEHSDNSGSWVEILIEREKIQVSIVIGFDHEGDVIDDVSVYKTPIERVIKNDKTKRIC